MGNEDSVSAIRVAEALASTPAPYPPAAAEQGYEPSVASADHPKELSSARRVIARPRLGPPILAGLAVFLAVGLIGEFRFRGVARLRPAGNLPEGQVAAASAELLALLNQVFPSSFIGAPQWTIQTNEQEIAVTVWMPTPSTAADKARAIAEQLNQKLKDRARAAAAIPTLAEQLVSENLERHADTARHAQEQLEEASQRADTEAFLNQDRLLVRWRALRSTYESARAELDPADALLAQMESKGPPASASPRIEDVEVMTAGDLALQQDSKELAIQLHLLHREMTAAAGPIAQAAADASEAASALEHVAARLESHPEDERLESMLEAMQAGAVKYREVVEQFLADWDKEAAALGLAPNHPWTSKLPEIQERLHQMLGDFFHAAQGELSALDKAINEIQKDPAEAVRRFDLVSAIAREGQTLLAAHRRLMASADELDTASNFRLDAASRGARGLRSRCRARVQAIEEALAAEALKQARMAFAAELDSLRIRTAELRKKMDVAIGELVQVHGELVEAMTKNHEYIADAARSELLIVELQSSHAELDRVQRQLEELVRQRRASAEASPLELIAVASDRMPADLPSRLSSAGLAGVVTLLAMLFGHFWNVRRNA